MIQAVGTSQVARPSTRTRDETAVQQFFVALATSRRLPRSARRSRKLLRRTGHYMGMEEPTLPNDFIVILKRKVGLRLRDAYKVSAKGA